MYVARSKIMQAASCTAAHFCFHARSAACPTSFSPRSRSSTQTDILGLGTHVLVRGAGTRIQGGRNEGKKEGEGGRIWVAGEDRGFFFLCRLWVP
ncbi:hypothetical protein ACMFMF_003362 [Clarireedia jacksonii]